MTLPLYILRRFVEPGGGRLWKPPAPPAEVAGICPVCSKAVLRTKLMGYDQLDGIWYMNDVYHYKCPRPHVLSENFVPLHVRLDRIPKGNLGEEEYRFWIGGVDKSSNFALCRACRKSVYSPFDRKQHFADSKWFVGGDPCSTRLVNAYKILSALPACIICKKSRFGKGKWGVPLCEQADCVRNWMFEQQRWIPLEQQLELQRKKAEFMERQPEKVTTLVIVPDTRKWCPRCSMFEEEFDHAKVHAAWLHQGHC